MAIYLYQDKATFLHRLNPITKIICLLLLFVAAMIFNHPLYLLGLGIFLFVLGIRPISLWGLKKVWILMLALGLFSVILWSFFYKGRHPIFRYGILSVSTESILYGIGMGLRLNIMLFCGLLFLSTTRVEDFAAGLNRMGLPFAVSFALSLAFRLVPTFLDTASTIVQAQKSRGLDLESGSLLKRIRKYIPLLIPIFICALRQADKLSMALESKGFGGRIKRTYYIEYLFRPSDWLSLGLLLTLNVIFICLRLSGLGSV